MSAMSKKSELEIWLRSQSMSTKHFSIMVGCSRTILWKVKNNLPICVKFAERIFNLTDGKVNPLLANNDKKKL